MAAIALEKHLPALFLAQVARHDEGDPFTVSMPAAVMMTDISGFSALAVAFTREGDDGVERLQAVLDRYFGALGGVVARFGGDICTFAGDAVIAVWPDGDAPAAAAAAAVHCALAIQREAAGWSSGTDVGLTQRIAVARGDVRMCKLGGSGGQWLHAVAGAPVVESGRACDLTTPGEVLVTPGVAALLGGPLRGQPGPGGCTRVDALDAPLTPTHAPAPPALDADRLAPYVPAVVVRRARAGQHDWLAEFRRVTVMFARLDSGSVELADPARLQAVALAVQQAVQRYGGALPYVQMDDKGLNFIVAHGIPSATYEDDAARSLLTGLEIQRALRAIGARPSIGVATGVLFCGECGAAHRRQYSMIGPSINAAARLASSAPDDLLADEPTSRAAGGRLSFTIARQVRLKHGDGTALAFRPEGRTRPAGDERAAGSLVGRTDELAALTAAVATAPAGTAARLLVSGEPGIGKSRLLQELREALERRGLRVIAGEAQALERDTPYFIWRDLLRGLLAALVQEAETERQTALRLLGGDPQLAAWLPLLDDILPLVDAPSALTREMTGTARAQAIQDLLLRLLGEAGAHAPLVLLLDDLHWIDSASAGLLAGLAERAPGLSVVAGSRPLEGAESDAAAWSFLRLPGLRRFELGALDAAQAAELVARLLQVASVPPDLAELIHGRGEGNPFYMQQLTLALREGGHIEAAGGRCLPHPDIALRVSQSMPPTLQGVIVSRVDRLGDQQQLLLKVASVFGRMFSVSGLAAALPDPQPADQVGALLSGLAGSRLVVPERSERDDGFAFAHALVQEAIYHLLPVAQRKRLHRRIADWLEAQHAELMAGHFGVLASHCMRAEEFQRALVHLEGGARTAMRHASYREAIRHIETAQQVAEERRVAADLLRRARWHSLLGDSRHELSELPQARADYLQALALLGRRPPMGALARTGGVLLHLCRLALTGRTAAAPRALVAGDAAEASRLASRAYAQLSEIAYYDNDPVAVLHLTLLSEHEAQRCASVRELSAAHGALAIAFGQMGMVGTARRHVRQSLALAQSQPQALNVVAYANLLALVFATSQCDWPLLDGSAAEAERLYGELGERFRVAAVQSMRANAALQRGRVAEAEARLAAMAAVVGVDTPARVHGWRLAPMLKLGMMRGHVEPSLITAAQDTLGGAQTPLDRLMSLGLIAAAWLHVGEPARALAAAREGAELLLGRTPVAGAAFVHGPLGVVEALLAGWHAVPATDLPAHAALTVRACGALRTYLRQVPSSRPRGLFLLACHAERLGRQRQALALMQQAARAAATLSMPYDEGVALAALGARPGGGQAHAERARAIFDTLQVPPPALHPSPAA